MSAASGRFEVVSPFSPMGDQPRAIEELSARLRGGARHACLLGATGTGKTFTMAHVIAALQKPTLILSHNKTLAAQLYEEMRELFPRNAVSYFVSYYDYYQPEAYIPQRDIYIEKDSSRNDDLDKLRLAATSNILSRRDTIVVASVSCIFGLGSPETYAGRVLTLRAGARVERRELLLALLAMQYKRAEMDFARGMFRVRGDVLDIYPAYEQFAVRVELFGDEIEKILLINPISGEATAQEREFFLFPASHYVTDERGFLAVLAAIRRELDERIAEFRQQGKLLEAARLAARTKYDLEMLQETGVCPGIENYSRHMDGRRPGERPWTLMDYFDYAPRADAPATPRLREAYERRRLLEELQVSQQDAAAAMTRGPAAVPVIAGDTPSPERADAKPNQGDWLFIVDESHVTVPQVRAMFFGDRNRKQTLVEHGFRLPSALDNRPLRFEEFEASLPRVLYVSATPAPYELDKVSGEVSEQVIRPTGLLDPSIEVRPTNGQIPDLIQRCKDRVAKGQRVIVTALTKRLCEELTRYLDEKDLRVRFLHSDIETLERVEILTDLRSGAFDVLVGVNLLREGLDLPEVSLVCILDADKEGFLRSATSLIQQIGRAARHAEAHVVLYADKVTPAMRAAMDETSRRRERQEAFNAEHGITPRTIQKSIRRGIELELAARRTARLAAQAPDDREYVVGEVILDLEQRMLAAAQELEFEEAARLRDQSRRLRERQATGGSPKAKAYQLGLHPSDAEEGGGGKIRGRKRPAPAAKPGSAASIDRKKPRAHKNEGAAEPRGFGSPKPAASPPHPSPPAGESPSMPPAPF